MTIYPIKPDFETCMYIISGMFGIFCMIGLVRRKADNEQEKPKPTETQVQREYNRLYELIQGAATKEEIEWLKIRIDEFEETYRGVYDVQQDYTDLLSELQGRFNVLSVKRLQKA